MNTPKITFASGLYDRFLPLYTKEVVPEGVDLDFVVEHCSRAIVLDEGRVRADGPTQDVLADPVLMDRHGLEVPLRLRMVDS